MPKSKGRAGSKARQQPYRRRTEAESTDESPEVVSLAPMSDSAAGKSGSDARVFSSILSQPIDDLLGSSQAKDDFALPDNAISCADDDMTLHVSPDLIKKIWLGEFVRLGDLLKRNTRETGEQSLCLNEQGLIVTKPKSTRSIRDIREWTDAFLIYMSVYLRKNPGSVFEMIKYMQTIRDAEQRCGSAAWLAYDENFRMRQAVSLQPWNKINSDLWLRCMTFPTQHQTAAQTTYAGRTLTQISKSDKKPRGICLDFNSLKGCNFRICKFAHRCLSCNKEHPEFKCTSNFRSNNSQLNQNRQARN